MIARGIIEKKMNNLLKSQLNKRLNNLEIGKVTYVKINLKTKSGIIKVDLEGELEELIIKLEDIRCKREKGRWQLDVSCIEVSKKWIEILILKNLENIKSLVHHQLDDLLNNKTILVFKIGQLCNLIF